MSAQEQFERIIEIARGDGRYAPEAFFFVSRAVQQTVEWLKDGSLPADGPQNRRSDGQADEELGPETFHVSGQEVLAGLRRLARERYGLLARVVLSQWGVRRTEDIGEIVFAMVEDEKLAWRKRECDTREDFARGYDFREAFDAWPEDEDR